jgi:hypothetical protein
MKIQVTKVKENKDGTANAYVEFDKEGLKLLLEWGLNAMLLKGFKAQQEAEEEFDMDGRC